MPAGTICALVTIFAMSSSLILFASPPVAVAASPAILRVARRQTPRCRPRLMRLSRVTPLLVSVAPYPLALNKLDLGDSLVLGSVNPAFCAKTVPYFDHIISL